MNEGKINPLSNQRREKLRNKTVLTTNRNKIKAFLKDTDLNEENDPRFKNK
jgi:hypothetical protein